MIPDLRKYFPMSPGAAPKEETWECDCCGERKPISTLTTVVVYKQTMTDPEEAIEACEDCYTDPEDFY